jgi:DNA (cytosine-5)-methyltransferase 1
MTTTRMSIGSLFSGIGGLDLGIMEAMEDHDIESRVSWFCDQDVYARQVMKFHHPRAAEYSNLYNIATPYRPQFIRYPTKVDVITAGFPCKNISIARLRSASSVEGIQGNQSGLIIPAMNLFKKLKPKHIVLENVRGVLVDSNMRYIVFTLLNLGYAVSWSAIPAGVLNATHLRDRIFILATRVGDTSYMPDFPVFSSDIVQEVKDEEGELWKATPEGLNRLIPEGVVSNLYRGTQTQQKVKIRCALNALGNAVAPPCAKVVGLTMLRGPNRPEYPYEARAAKLSGKSWKSPSEAPAPLLTDGIEKEQSWPRCGYAVKIQGEVLTVALPEAAPLRAMVEGSRKNVYRPYKMYSDEEAAWLERTGKDPRWPTPVAMLSVRPPKNPDDPGFVNYCSTYRDSLADAVQLEEDLGPYATGEGRFLNPAWVEWMMGFPSGWLDIPNGNTGCTLPGAQRLGIQPKYKLTDNPQLSMFPR